MIHMVIRNRDPDCFKPINYATKSHVNLLNLNFRLAKVESVFLNQVTKLTFSPILTATFNSQISGIPQRLLLSSRHLEWGKINITLPLRSLPASFYPRFSHISTLLHHIQKLDACTCGIDRATGGGIIPQLLPPTGRSCKAPTSSSPTT